MMRMPLQLNLRSPGREERGGLFFFYATHINRTSRNLRVRTRLGMAVKAVIFDAWGLVLKNNLKKSFIQFESSRGLPSNFLNESIRKSGSSMNLLYSGKINETDAQSRLEQEIASRGLKLSQNIDLIPFLKSIRSEIRVNGDVRDALQCG
jgi:hypothetical protein